MNSCYVDCISGISGDMVLGALLDAGLPIEHLVAELSKLKLNGWAIDPIKVSKAGIMATYAGVRAEESHHHRGYHDIAHMIEESTLAPEVAEMALRVFRRLGEAEAKVHGVALNEVHFHEVGAVDSIVDIVGACIGFKALEIDAIYGSPLPWTHGTVKAAHGVMPIPAPATVELMRGWPTEPLDIEEELVTPTGAAILTTLADGRGMIPMQVETVAYGAGLKDIEGRPNVLRLVIGQHQAALDQDTVVEVETNLDDMNPEWVPQAVEEILNAGAIDVFLAQGIMKKGRPALHLTALCQPHQLNSVSEAILRHTTTLGTRYHSMARVKLRRESTSVETPWGTVSVKKGYWGNESVNAAPEFEDCLRLSRESGKPLKEIYAAALKGSNADNRSEKTS